MSILDIINPVKIIADTANEIIGKFVTDPNQRLQYQQNVLTQTTQLQLKAMELQGQLVEAQSKVITAEAQGDSLQRDWRPLLMLFFALIMGFAVFNSGHDPWG